MIKSKTLGSAAGIQYQGVIDNSESTSLPSLANGVIVGRFKRGRMDKPFKVTAANYQAILGRDPSNPNYLAVEDAFKRGVSEVSVLRVGSTGADGSAGGGSGEGSGGGSTGSGSLSDRYFIGSVGGSSIRYETGYLYIFQYQINDETPVIVEVPVNQTKLVGTNLGMLIVDFTPNVFKDSASGDPYQYWMEWEVQENSNWVTLKGLRSGYTAPKIDSKLENNILRITGVPEAERHSISTNNPKLRIYDVGLNNNSAEMGVRSEIRVVASDLGAV